MPTEFAYQYGRRALPQLVQCAKLQQTITYKELADAIGIHPRSTRSPLNYISDEICVRGGLPMITTIVINKRTRLPGRGLHLEGTGQLSEEQYARAVEEHQQRVFDYQGWDAVLRAEGLKPPPRR
jgi:hypothetical protein